MGGHCCNAWVAEQPAILACTGANLRASAEPLILASLNNEGHEGRKLYSFLAQRVKSV
jgi:hypothetical protein